MSDCCLVLIIPSWDGTLWPGKHLPPYSGFYWAKFRLVTQVLRIIDLANFHEPYGPCD